MILVDTSVWIDHFRQPESVLVTQLQHANVIIHPFIIGELACGNLNQRQKILSLLKALPEASVATQEEVLGLMDKFKLMGQGIGWVDCHLLASAHLDSSLLWTRDKKLHKIADTLSVAHHSA